MQFCLENQQKFNNRQSARWVVESASISRIKCNTTGQKPAQVSPFHSVLLNFTVITFDIVLSKILQTTKVKNLQSQAQLSCFPIPKIKVSNFTKFLLSLPWKKINWNYPCIHPTLKVFNIKVFHLKWAQVSVACFERFLPFSTRLHVSRAFRAMYKFETQCSTFFLLFSHSTSKKSSHVSKPRSIMNFLLGFSLSSLMNSMTNGEICHSNRLMMR